jgi:hypothetical protein
MPLAPAILTVICACSIALAQQKIPESEPQAAPLLQIVEGDGAINSIRRHRGHDPIVRVTTSDGEPIAGASVTFLLPSAGPSGTFAGSEGISLTVESDGHGLAVGRGLRPNDVAGAFRIRVNTSWHGSPVAINLSQTNAEPVAHSSHTKAIVIIAVVVAAVAGGAVAATSGHSSSPSQPPPTTSSSGSIVSGTPTIGPPH